MEIFGYTLDLFWVGVIGSLAVEIIASLGHLDEGGFPPKYKRISFYLLRAALAGMGGFLVVAYSIEHAMAAFQIGASAPVILLSLSRKEELPN